MRRFYLSILLTMIALGAAAGATKMMFGTSDGNTVDCGIGFTCGRVAQIDDRQNEAQSERLRALNPNGSRRTKILDFGPSSGKYAGPIVDSKNHRKLFFAASRDSTFDSGLFAVNAEGSGLTNIKNSGGIIYSFRFSPKENTIELLQNRSGNEFNTKIYLVNADGTNQRRLTTSQIFGGGFYQDLASDFAPHGSRRVCRQVVSFSPFTLAAQLVPTAANVVVSGRVANEYGTGFRGVRLTLLGTDGITRAATTTFGNFRSDDVPAGRNYVVTAVSRRFTFAEPTCDIAVEDKVTDLEFIAAESPR